MHFNYKKLQFFFEFTTDSRRAATHDVNGIEWGLITEIFIPNYHYEDFKVVIEVSDGIYRYDKGRQTIYWRYDPQYKGKTRKEFDQFYDEDEGIFEFIISLMNLFLVWIFSFIWISPIRIDDNNEVIHWIYIHPNEKL